MSGHSNAVTIFLTGDEHAKFNRMSHLKRRAAQVSELLNTEHSTHENPGELQEERERASTVGSGLCSQM